MIKQPKKPADLKALCIVFLLWSALSLAENVQRWGVTSVAGVTTYSVPVDFGSFGFLASIGLWRLAPPARTFARVLTWYWLVGSVLLFFQVFPARFLIVTSNSDFLAGVPTNILRAFVVPFFLAQLWQLYTLRRPHIRALFAPASKQSKP